MQSSCCSWLKMGAHTRVSDILQGRHESLSIQRCVVRMQVRLEGLSLVVLQTRHATWSAKVSDTLVSHRAAVLVCSYQWQASSVHQSSSRRASPGRLDLEHCRLCRTAGGYPGLWPLSGPAFTVPALMPVSDCQPYCCASISRGRVRAAGCSTHQVVSVVALQRPELAAGPEPEPQHWAGRAAHAWLPAGLKLQPHAC